MFYAAVIAFWLILTAGDTYAAALFYEGKTIRIVVGASAGGGFDTYSRTIARHMGRRISGNPTIIVENMPGAGMLIAANYMYKIAKPWTDHRQLHRVPGLEPNFGTARSRI